MKKFMKAIAFVTVMCMALSTVAFAAGSVDNGVDSAAAGTDKKITVNVEGAKANQQVALVLVSGTVTGTNGITQDNIEYIDQKPAGNDGKAAFGPITTKTTPDEVSVFVGYEGAAENYVGTVTLKEPITKVTIEKVAADIILQATNTEGLVGEQQEGAGVAIKFDVEAPDGVYATNMIWAIRYTDANGPQVKYTDAFDVAEYEIGTTLKTGIQLGLAFLNGYNRLGEEIDPVTITGVDAIFLFTDGEEILTNENDWKNEDPNNKY